MVAAQLFNPQVGIASSDLDSLTDFEVVIRLTDGDEPECMDTFDFTTPACDVGEERMNLVGSQSHITVFFPAVLLLCGVTFGLTQNT